MKRFIPLFLLFIAGPVFADSCWVTPLETMRSDADDRDIPVGDFSADNTQVSVIKVMTITATEQSTAMPDGTQMARLVCDIVVFFAASLNPTATTSDNYLPADTIEYIGIEAGHKLAFCDADCT